MAKPSETVFYNVLILTGGKVGPHYAREVVRLLAFGIDAALLAVPLGVGSFTVFQEPLAMLAFGQAMYAAYFIGLWSWLGGGRTVGMRILKLRVQRPSGRTLSLGRALLRYVALFASFFAFGLPLLVAVVSDRRRAWHDVVADSVVIGAA